jgi:hypothetical protein
MLLCLGSATRYSPEKEPATQSSSRLLLMLRYLVLVSALLFTIAPSHARAASVIYAAPIAIGAHTGADWANAKDLQAALQAATAGDQIWAKAGTYKPTAVQGGYSAGTHIINANPQFVDADGADNLAGTLDDNVRIGAGSPVIDVGDNGYIPADLTDDDGDGDSNETAPFDLGSQPRRRGAVVDLGAYERNTAPLTTSYLPLILREST